MAWRWRWRMRHKLGAGLALVVGIVAILAGGAFYGLYAFRRANKSTGYHNQLILRAMELQHQVTALTLRGQAEGDDPAAMLGKLAEIDESVRQYRAVLDKSPGYALAPQVIDDQHACLAKVTQCVEVLRKVQRGEKLLDGANPFNWLQDRRVGDYAEILLAQLATLRDRVGFQQRENNRTHRNNHRTALGLVYSSTALVLVLLGGLVRLGYQAVFQPVRELHQGVAKLAKGDFAARVEVATGDEFQDLGEAFNDMKEQLAASYRGLERQVEERSRQLIRSERLASVGFLAAGVAHEINNPLASIAFCAEALESRLPKSDAAAEDAEGQVFANYLKMIQQEAFRCKGITEKLLDFSRAGAQERTDVEASAVVRDTLEMVKTLGRAKGKELRFEPGGPAFCWANVAELKQVLLNLVVNALESVDDGGAVTVRTRPAPGGGAEVSVRDDGCGMDRDTLENLFEPFFTRSRTGKGTGLGLSISHLIVSQHGGALEASSDGPGHGSVFTVRIPARAALRLAA